MSAVLHTHELFVRSAEESVREQIVSQQGRWIRLRLGAKPSKKGGRPAGIIIQVNQQAWDHSRKLLMLRVKADLVSDTKRPIDYYPALFLELLQKRAKRVP